MASMVADFSGSTTVVPGADVNGADDMTGDLEVQECGVLYVSGEESAQQVGCDRTRFTTRCLCTALCCCGQFMHMAWLLQALLMLCESQW